MALKRFLSANPHVLKQRFRHGSEDILMKDIEEERESEGPESIWPASDIAM